MEVNEKKNFKPGPLNIGIDFVTLSGRAVVFSVASMAATTVLAQTNSTGESAGDGALEEVVVTGIRQSLKKSLDIKRDSTGVVDAIVAEDIGKFPDANVAESLQRVPGVYLSRNGASNEGNRISIRGLGSSYAVTTINGAPVHTTSNGNVGGSTRDFNYDVFPSELFGQVNVYKSPLAELNEGGIGGTVDLQTPRPFDNNERVVRYSAQASYNDASEQTNPRGSALFSDTWGNFGALVGFAHAQSRNTRSGYQATGQFNTSALGRVNDGTFPFALDYDDPRANLGDYTQEQVDNAFLPRFHRAYASQNDRERTAGIVSLQFRNDKLDVSLDTLIAKLTDQSDEYTFGIAIRNSGLNGVPGMVPIDIFIDEANNNLMGTFGNTIYMSESYLYDSETDFRSINLRAVYDMADTLKLKGQITATKSEAEYSANRIVVNAEGVTSTIDYSRDIVYPVLTSDRDFTDPLSFDSSYLGYQLRNENDEDNLAQLELQWDYEAGDWLGTLKTGLTYVESTKTTTKRNGTTLGADQTLPNGLTFATMTEAQRLALMDTSMPIAPYAKDASSGFPTNWATFSRSTIENFFMPNRANLASPIDYNSSFVAEEAVTSFYVQTDLRSYFFDREFRANLGVRYSDTKVSIDNYTLDSGVYVPNQSSGGYDTWLPSISAAYDLREDLVLRASWGQTITRAGLTDIAGNIVIPNPFDTFARAGNPNLLPQTSNQWDLGIEWYFNEGGLLAVGAFWKSLKDTTESSTETVPFSSLGLPDTALGPIYNDETGRVPPDLPITLETKFNGSEEKLKGLEVAYQQNFTFLPAPLDGLGALASYTRVDTESDDWISNAGVAHEINWVPKYGYSVTGFYEKGPLSLRFSYNYKDDSIMESKNKGNDLQRWRDGVGYLDAAFSYHLSDRLELRLEALNLNNELTYEYFPNPDGLYGSGKSRRNNALYNGRTFTLGLRGSF